MLTRMKWVNLVALWKAINQTGWHPSFDRENRRISDFNMFLRANFAAANTFITKEVSRAYGCVVAPCRLTSGSFLTPVGVTVSSGGVYESDLAYTATIGNSTTLKAFSEEIIENNPGWEPGDKLTILMVQQNMTANIPNAKATAVSVTLRVDDDAETTLLNEFFDPSLITTDGTGIQLVAMFEGGAAFVHSRIVDGETLCSTQNLVVNNRFLSTYQGLQAFNRAAESYGGIARNQLLTPDVVSDFVFQP